MNGKSFARILFSALIVTGLLNLSAVCSWAQSPAETLFKSKCAACHGADGQGNVPMGKKLGAHNLKSPEVQTQSDAQLAAVVTKGQNHMPAYGGKLSADQINDLVKFIRSLK
ncbi:MAG: c-type cytochrome [Actinomycetota bacterium]